jgi:hypothetical protein
MMPFDWKAIAIQSWNAENWKGLNLPQPCFGMTDIQLQVIHRNTLHVETTRAQNVAK